MAEVEAFRLKIGDSDFYRYRHRAVKVLEAGKANTILDAFALAAFVEKYL